MIIMITEYCTMECNHCCMNASKNGKHMSKETFLKALDFYKELDYPLVTVSGGEPTDHPQFEEFMEEIKKRNFESLVLSNGLWTMDDRRDKYLAKYKFQIINDERYYPIKVPKVEHPNILVFEKVENLIYKCTRTIANGNYQETKPKCFNIRSIANFYNIHSFKDLLYIYRYTLLKFCIPIIRIDGSMIIGETDLCKAFGNINDELLDLFSKVKHFKCNNCGCFNNLSDKERNQLGE